MQRWYASRGIGGSGVAVRVGQRPSTSAFWVRVVSLTQGPNLTSFLCCQNRHPYPDRALSKSDCREKNRDGDVFHRDGVHPTAAFSAHGPNNERNSRPGGQYRLRDEAAKDKHDEGVKRGVAASVFTST